ncbi:hypothetical protein [Nitratireductor basaltis]|uniref:Putative fimbrial subunit PilA n=1 Tax=Nitratireductor basaltis TaxID=472175 RepID=A0A084U7C5_9HYPH|nr:hypothetical protein [Nitratireductor basaltis]KFB08861.1 putative fimbrial subunit PilA [Nitratireductor basaltis]
MTAQDPIEDREEEEPLDPAVERVRRKLIRFMAINLGILFAAVMAVVLAFVYKSLTMEGGEPSASIASPSEGSLPLPAGSTVLSHAINGPRVSIIVESRGGSREIIIYDLEQQGVVARIALSEDQ